MARDLIEVGGVVGRLVAGKYFGVVVIRSNIFPQDARFNTTTYRLLGFDFGRAVAAGKHVRVSVKPVYPEGVGKTFRSEKIKVEYFIDGATEKVEFDNAATQGRGRSE